MTVVTWDRPGLRRFAPRPLRLQLPSVPGAAILEAAASLSITAGLIHVFAAVGHAGEWRLAGAFFGAVAVAQVAFAFGLLRSPTRWMLMNGIGANAALIALWAVSRTTGMPFGPHAGVAEAVGSLDVAATALEVASIVALGMLLRHPAVAVARSAATRRSLAAAVVALAALTSASASAVAHVDTETAHIDEMTRMTQEASHSPGDADEESMEEHDGSEERTSCDAPVGAPATIAPNGEPQSAVAIVVAEDGRIVLLDPATNARSVIVTLDADCWAADPQFAGEDRVAFMYESSIWLVELSTGRIDKVLDRGDGWISSYDVNAGRVFAALEDNGEGVSSLYITSILDGLPAQVRRFTDGSMEVCGGWPQEVRFSPDGTMLSVQRMPAGGIKTHILRLDGSDVIDPIDGAAMAVWLADSSGVVFEDVGADRVTKLTLATGRRTTFALDGDIGEGALSPDGSTIAFGGYFSAGIDLLDLTTGKHRRLVENFGEPLWLDGSTLAATEQEPCEDCMEGRTGGDIVAVLDSDGSQVRTLALKNTYNADTLVRAPESLEDLTGSQAAAPTVTAPNDHKVTVLQRLTFTLGAHDPDSSSITFTATGLPRHARFDAASRTFTWRPRPGQEGTWIVTFTVTDETGRADSARVRIDVLTVKEHLECALLASCGAADRALAAVPPHASATSQDAGRAEARWRL